MSNSREEFEKYLEEALVLAKELHASIIAWGVIMKARKSSVGEKSDAD